MNKRTCVLIHGCHLYADDWESIIWGNPQEKILGRVPKALEVAEEFMAELIYWGTGASERYGLKESEYTFQYAVSELNKLCWFDPDWVKRVSYLDTNTQNTTEEILGAANICIERGYELLVLVSSPTHIARCLQEALKLRHAGKLGNIEVMAIASDTCFADSTPADVCIVEPPHRGDMPKVPFHRTVKGIFQFLKKPEVASGFNQALLDLIEVWKLKL